MDVNALHQRNLAEQEYLRQLLRSVHARRVKAADKIASSSSLALMILDSWVVDSAFRRLEVATKVVKCGTV